MATLLQRERSLPVFHHQSNDDQTSSVSAGMRRRLSSMSLQIHPSSISDTATAWAMRRSKSASSSIRNWWDWGWSWIISKKSIPDLEFNQFSSFRSNEETTWKHLFLKLRSEIRKIVRSDNVGLPQSVRYTPTKF